MRILVLGGSRFVGRHMVEAARARGHDVTLLNRGSGREAFPDLETVVADRDAPDAYAGLAGRSFDAVLDVSGYTPPAVRRAAEATAGIAERYAFVSTISVYPTDVPPGAGEDAPLLEMPEGTDPETAEVTGETYGPLKVLCERAVDEAFGPERALHLRPGVVVGPWDPTDRFTYWPERVRAAGRDGRPVLAPVGPDLPMQWIDGRDLAAFAVHALERGLSGPYNVVTPAGERTVGGLLAASAEAAGLEEGAATVWASEADLLAAGVRPFVDLPLWLPEAARGFARVSSERAAADGLTCRSTLESARDVLEWTATLEGEREAKAGLTRERELEVIEALG